jgi:spore germination cell wall hydrolase CwlJ-like protein
MKKYLKILVIFIIYFSLITTIHKAYNIVDSKLEVSGAKTSASNQSKISTDFDIDENYSLLMINSICTGNYKKGKEYESLRNMKLEYLGLEDDINYDELLLLSKIIHAEAGSSWITEEHRQLVASVVINRVNSGEFPNSIYEVIHQPKQYSPVNSGYFNSLIPSETSVKSAFEVITNGSIAPPDVVFQSGFKQGSGVYKVINDKILGKTYFCYSNNRNLYK